MPVIEDADYIGLGVLSQDPQPDLVVSLFLIEHLARTNQSWVGLRQDTAATHWGRRRGP